MPIEAKPADVLLTRRQADIAGGQTGQTATGIPTSAAGIVLPHPIQLYRVTAPNGRSAVLPQIDVGPDPSTEHTLDVSQGAQALFGYTQANFPTEARFKVEPVGGQQAGMRQHAFLAVRAPPLPTGAYLTRRQAADYIREELGRPMSFSTASKLAALGEFASVAIWWGRRPLYTREDLKAWANARSRAPQSTTT
jgi:hypothetical protein